VSRRTTRALFGDGVLLLACAYFVVPLCWLVLSASKAPGALFTSAGSGWSGRFSLITNVEDVFTYQGGIYAWWLLSSLIYAFGASTAGCLIGAMAGFALAKYEFPGKRLVFGLVLSGVLVPATALVIPLYLEFSHAHLVDTYWAVLLPSVLSPFGVYICRLYAAQAVPDALLDAGRVDGAGEWRIFRSVALPLMRPVIVTAFSFQFVAVWNNFFLPLVMDTSVKLYPVVLGLFEWDISTQRSGSPPFIFSVVLAGSLVAFVPLCVGFLFLQKALRRGLAIGAVR
jgi:multiple sugar transport system permease protein